ncbi:MAG: radical SAM protein [Deltaproteobacteria bacterium]|nr:radical SAM protein [Deltaproteobacteria bacterium]
MVRWLWKTVDWVCEWVWPHVDAQPPLLSVQFDITNACNLRCDHCYLPHHHNVGALTYAQWLIVVAQYEQLLQRLHMVPKITLCGGEPLLAPFVEPLLRELRRRFPTADLSVQSNGTIITERVARMLCDLAVFVQISVDGPDAARHDAIRGAGSFAKTMAGCAYLQHAAVPYHFQAVLSERSVPWVDDFFHVARAHHAETMDFVRLVLEGHAEQLTATGVDRPLVGAALHQAYTAIFAAAQRYNVSTNTAGPLWHLIEPELGTPDNTGFGSFVIDYQGGFKVTSRTPTVLGNVLQTDMAELFLRHPLMQQLRENKIDGCGTCSHFVACRGDRNASFAIHGHFFGPDTACWYWQQWIKSIRQVASYSLHERKNVYGTIQTAHAARVGTSAH